jgi:hypothetical protein
MKIAAWTCSIDVDMQHGIMHHGHGTCSFDMQHGDMDMQHGQAAWTSSTDMQHGHAVCTKLLYMQHKIQHVRQNGHTVHHGDMDMQNGHGHAAWG